MLDLSVQELLSYVYAMLVENADVKGRRKIDALFAGKLGPSGGIIVEDPDLPEMLQGQEAPSWWEDDHNPWADSQTISNVEM